MYSCKFLIICFHINLQPRDHTQIWVPANPGGAERLAPGIIEFESDFYLHNLWGLPNELLHMVNCFADYLLLKIHRFVEIMAPVFSRDAWHCVWRMIQVQNIIFTFSYCSPPFKLSLDGLSWYFTVAYLGVVRRKELSHFLRTGYRHVWIGLGVVYALTVLVCMGSSILGMYVEVLGVSERRLLSIQRCRIQSSGIEREVAFIHSKL
ncbi:hypothetical protein RHGRI_023568 [Rhododendron griersonianum]|uniref:Uncharacterized protein n=1 Tax=Rhododendron griersonianum TaxID=479676 RepID=A0AAV6J449_9ERIC|nr:hypothetical protein RHGRI_023568 [Rhododendron griersonianum]